MSTAAASSSHRRSSRRVRSDDSSPSAADSSNYGLTADETALQLLVQNVLEGDWTAARDPDNVMKKIWVRSGRDVEGGVDGVDFIKEDGFTVAKYEEIWRAEISDDVVIGWAHKLPAEAKGHIDVELLPAEDRAAGTTAAALNIASEVSPAGSSGEDFEKQQRKKAGSSKTAKKRKEVASNNDNGFDDEEDYLPALELRAARNAWFQALEAGKSKVLPRSSEGPGGGDSAAADGASAKKKSNAKIRGAAVPKSKRRKVEVEAFRTAKASARTVKGLYTHGLFARDLPDSAGVVGAYKSTSIDPAAERMVSAINAYVAREAEALRSELMADCVVDNYRFGVPEEIFDTELHDQEQMPTLEMVHT